MRMYVSWKIRVGSVMWEYDNPQNSNRRLFAAWEPPDAIKIETLLLRADGEGGYAIFECDDANELLKVSSTFAPWFEFELVPVTDMLDGIDRIEEAVSWRDEVLRGSQI